MNKKRGTGRERERERDRQGGNVERFGRDEDFLSFRNSFSDTLLSMFLLPPLGAFPFSSESPSQVSPPKPPSPPPSPHMLSTCSPPTAGAISSEFWRNRPIAGRGVVQSMHIRRSDLNQKRLDLGFFWSDETIRDAEIPGGTSSAEKTYRKSRALPLSDMRPKHLEIK